MSSFLSQLAIDAAQTFLSDFAEPVIFTPFGGAAVTYQAILTRDAASLIPGLGGANVYKHEISLANDPAGINGPAAINKGRDTVQFANVVGGTIQTFAILQILKNDQGMFHLGVG